MSRGERQRFSKEPQSMHDRCGRSFRSTYLHVLAKNSPTAYDFSISGVQDSHNDICCCGDAKTLHVVREKCLQLHIPKSPCGIPVSVDVHDCHFCAPVAGQTEFLQRKLTPYAYCLTEWIPLALTMLNGNQTVCLLFRSRHLYTLKR